MVGFGPDCHPGISAAALIGREGREKKLCRIRRLRRCSGDFFRRRHGDLWCRLSDVVFLNLGVPQEVFEEERRPFPLVVYMREREALPGASQGNVKQSTFFLNLEIPGW